jgi:hypothetical protein
MDAIEPTILSVIAGTAEPVHTSPIGAPVSSPIPPVNPSNPPTPLLVELPVSFIRRSDSQFQMAWSLNGLGSPSIIIIGTAST